MPASASISPAWIFVVILAAAAGAAWTIWDALQSGRITAGRGIWHRTVCRDDDPLEYWLALFGNCVLLLFCLGGAGYFALNYHELFKS